jgi:hypothetical protein
MQHQHIYLLKIREKMQTFVPYESFIKSAVVLDNKRLNKQLLEGRQIYKILSSNQTSGAWVNHPAVKMWRGYEFSLYKYLEIIKEECDFRGISTEKNWNALTEMHKWNWHRGSNIVMPPWWGDERVHQSHRNNLYKKDPEFYVEFNQDGFVSCCEKCNYFWPTHTVQYNGNLTTV